MGSTNTLGTCDLTVTATADVGFSAVWCWSKYEEFTYLTVSGSYVDDHRGLDSASDARVAGRGPDCVSDAAYGRVADFGADAR